MENQTEALNQLEVGQLVKSRAGRDLGSYYLVYRLASRGGKQTKAWLVGRGADNLAEDPSFFLLIFTTQKIKQDPEATAHPLRIQ